MNVDLIINELYIFTSRSGILLMSIITLLNQKQQINITDLSENTPGYCFKSILIRLNSRYFP